MKLNKEDSKKFLETMENPPKPTDKLVELLEEEKMKFKKDQKIIYRNGKIGTILTVKRKKEDRPIVSITESGEIWAHTPSGKLFYSDECSHDIVSSVPQGRALIGHLCGVSDTSLELAQERAECGSPYLAVILDYWKGDDFPYKDTASNSWKYAWPVAKQDIEKHLWDKESK